MSEETIPDIVAEMRSRGSEISGLLLPDDGGPTRAMTPKLADRIEAAAERDQAPGPSSGTKPGSAAALRAVVERCRDYLSDLLTLISTEDETRLLKECDAALSAPARNCDMTNAPDELLRRFIAHCDKCNPPLGCCHRKDTRGMLDINCASILKCFARFVTEKGGAHA